MQRTYYEDDGPAWSWWDRPSADDEPVTPADDIHTLRWGYNLSDIQRLAHLARSSVIGPAPASGAYQHAWDGIISALYEATERPEPRDLIIAGSQAATHAHRDDMRHRGISKRTKGTGPRVAMYWSWMSRPSSSPEGTVVERTALWQIWPRLTESQRDALLALAVHEDHQDAAAALGKSRLTFASQLCRARKRFLDLWHEHEKPSALWGADVRRRTDGSGDRAEGAGYRRAIGAMKRRRAV